MKNAIMESMEKKYGSFEYEGEKYILIEDAYLDDIFIDGQEGRSAYLADAIKPGDSPDEDGYIPLYKMEWEIINPEMEDESDRCDWEAPADVRDSGARFNINDGSIY